jgi:CRP-like cAMP-binding protein
MEFKSMISPELVKRYPFFAGLTESQVKAVAMLAQENVYPEGTTIFNECDLANHLFILMEGSVDLYYRSVKELQVKELFVGDINPGEAFGTSAIIDQNEFNATAKTAVSSRVIELDAHALHELMTQDPDLANKILLQVIKTLKERLMSVRVQLAASLP